MWGGNIVLEDSVGKFYRYTEIFRTQPQSPVKVLCDLETATVSFAFHLFKLLTVRKKFKYRVFMSIMSYSAFESEKRVNGCSPVLDPRGSV